MTNRTALIHAPLALTQHKDLVQVLQRDTKELRRVTRLIAAETGVGRYFRHLLHKPNQLTNLLDLEQPIAEFNRLTVLDHDFEELP